MFSFFEALTDFSKVCTILHSYKHRKRGPTSPHLSPNYCCLLLKNQWMYLFNFIFGCPASSLLCRLSRAAASRGCSLLQVTDFLHWALGCTGSIVWHTDLAAPRHVGSSQLRYQTLSSAWAGRFSATGSAAKPPICLDSIHSSGYDVVSHCGFDLNFFND